MSKTIADMPKETTDASAGDIRTLFPLPMTPFERYMTVDDRQGYPMTFAAMLEFRGDLSREALEEAAATLCERHPLLTARIQGLGKNASWQNIDSSPLAVDWCETPPSPKAFEQQKLDLTSTAPFHIKAYSQNGHARLVLSFHHAMTDGIGASQIMGDLLAAYGKITGEHSEQPRFLKTHPSLISQRGEIQITLPAPVSRWQAFRSFWQETWKTATRRSAPLETLRAHRRATEENEGILFTTLKENIRRDYLARAASSNVTANDLLIRDLFVTIRSWNESRNSRRSRRWLRMAIPINLRSRRDLRMPACNILGYALLTRDEKECDLTQEFLEHLASDILAVRKWGLGAMFLQSLSIIDRIPGALYIATRLSRSFATIVLSNLGDPVRRFRATLPSDENQHLIVGNLVLERLVMAPPMRPGTSLAVGFHSYGGVFNVGLHYDNRRFTATEAREFLQLYVDQIEKTSQPKETILA